MQIRAGYKLTSFCVIAAFGLFGLVACNSDTNSGTANTSDSSMKTAGTDSTMKDSTMTAKTTKKRRKASAILPTTGTEKMMKDKDGVYNWAEKMPEYPGGQDALSAYINDHINDSQAPSDDNTTGKLKISFVVDEKGKVMDVHVLGQKLGNGLDAEVVRLISNMPDWTPGKVKGKNVKTRLELPISFESES